MSNANSINIHKNRAVNWIFCGEFGSKSRKESWLYVSRNKTKTRSDCKNSTRRWCKVFALLHDVVQELSITRFIVSRWANFPNFLRRRSPETALCNRHLGEHVCCRGILCLKRRSAFTFTRRYEVLFLLVNFFFEKDSISVPTASSDRFFRHAHAGLQIKVDFMIQNHAMRIDTKHRKQCSREMNGWKSTIVSHKDDFRFYSRPNCSRQAKCVLRSFALARNKNLFEAKLLFSNRIWEKAFREFDW